MRLIGTFETEKQAYVLGSLLLKEGIQNIYEPFLDSETHQKRYHLWVYDENDLERASDWLKRYQENPEDEIFQHVQIPLIAIPPPIDLDSDSEEKKGPRFSIPLPPRFQPKKFTFTLTHFLLAICVFLFLWNDLQEAELLRDKGPLGVQLSFTPMQQALIFDYPSSFESYEKLILSYPLQSYKDFKELPPEMQLGIEQADKAPMWKGLYDYLLVERQKGEAYTNQITLFEKIREGQVWRLFTPCLLHRDFLHILFNMAWLWLLAKQIEQRMRKSKMILLILAIGIVSNSAQYIMSGPYFMGFSGIVVGMAGFIWMRQRKAPWEGYPLNKGTFIFLLLFVLSMFLLEIFTFGLQLFSVINIAPNIANTAHIVGGLCGALLGRLPFFGRGRP